MTEGSENQKEDIDYHENEEEQNDFNEENNNNEEEDLNGGHIHNVNELEIYFGNNPGSFFKCTS